MSNTLPYVPGLSSARPGLNPTAVTISAATAAGAILADWPALAPGEQRTVNVTWLAINGDGKLVRGAGPSPYAASPAASVTQISSRAGHPPIVTPLTVTNSNPTSLQALTLSNTDIKFGEPFTANVFGQTPGSHVALSGPGSVGLKFSRGVVSGIPRGIGDVILTETLLGAGGSPNGSVVGTAAFGAGGALVTLSRNAIIVAIGSSIIAGQSAGVGVQQAVKSWPGQLADLLNAAGVNASDDSLWGDHGCWGQAQSIANYAAGDGRLAYTGSFVLGSSEIPGGNGFALTAAGSGTFTPRFAGNEVDVYYQDVGTGKSFTVQVGTGAPITVNPANTNTVAKVTVPAPSFGIHPVTITWAAGVTGLWGAVWKDTTKPQVRIYNWGISGGSTGTMTQNGAQPIGRLSQYGFHMPDCAFIEGGLPNDWRGGTPVATTKSRLTTLVQTMKAAKSGACKVILMTPLPDPSTAGNAANQEQYVTALREVAAEQGVPTLDIRAVWQSHAYAVSQGWTPNGDIHPTTAGYAKIADEVRKAIAVTA